MAFNSNQFIVDQVSDKTAGQLTDLDGGKAGGATPATDPAGGHPDDKQKATEAEVKSPEGAKDAPVDRKTLKNDVLSGLKTKHLTPEEQIEFERDQAARFAKTSRFNNEIVKAYNALLEKQGIEVSIEKGKSENGDDIPVIEWTPGKGYAPKVDGRFKVDIKDIPEDIRESAGENLQKFADYVTGLANKSLVRVLATAEKTIPELAEEKIDSVISLLGKTTNPELLKYPENVDAIKAFIRDSDSKEFKSMLAKHPDLMIRLLADGTEAEFLRAIKRDEEIKQKRLKSDEESRKKSEAQPTGSSENNVVEKVAETKGDAFFNQFVV